MPDYSDILYDVTDAIATITINRPEKYNAFRARTVEELINAINRAGWDPQIAAIVLTGAGDKAFCTGGDQSSHEEDGGYEGGTRKSAGAGVGPSCRGPARKATASR